MEESHAMGKFFKCTYKKHPFYTQIKGPFKAYIEPAVCNTKIMLFILGLYKASTDQVRYKT